ncbi:MAG TPA: hypothetical protein DEQ87_11475 [Algoriphagus sp.]|jgi:FtsZ-binding cell division protein ZapB|uniref:DUF6090 family protein n=1 Tax=unclassified Algoriphagus TaxID=2641541 RepID=UPI000C504ADC|nr:MULTISPECIES: DUF6090 family protein [unclassified Algoriphagus]MAL13769.1 hypothetical protein [Algoriphagus sp.]MAN87681.1 hypothetical protein [Algoriphagus sp.]HAH36926.1 hypothetical protein [Algoriphagus sp.]HAS59717.1 hypothetical protein [Algoriphagus sp.]HAZ25832.1 hypothetical protein [Algoriphagus sp.]|tara:strand:+ start:3131 stop:3934 length:804 start_codon:yes stop_codon:yes gene_type:complete
MISFYRRIRQKLLKENRITRYLTYALGEIVLVTIGILIALQINTWKEERNDHKREISFYQSVLIDLESDQQKLETQTKFYQNRIENLTWLLKEIRQPQESINPEEFGKHSEPLYYSESAISFDTSYEAAKSAGSIAAFSNKILLKQLVEYYSSFQEIENVLTSTLRFIESTFEPLMASLPNNFLDKESSDQVLISQGNQNFYLLLESVEDLRPGVSPEELKKFLNQPEFESYVVADLGRSFNMISKLDSRITQLQSIQKDIKQYLEN